MFSNLCNIQTLHSAWRQVKSKNYAEKIANMIDKTSDRVIFYRICIGCYTKTDYLPPEKKEYGTVTIV